MFLTALLSSLRSTTNARAVRTPAELARHPPQAVTHALMVTLLTLSIENAQEVQPATLASMLPASETAGTFAQNQHTTLTLLAM